MKFDFIANFSIYDELETNVKRIFPKATNCTAVIGNCGISIIAYKKDNDLGNFYYSFRDGKATIINKYNHTQS